MLRGILIGALTAIFALPAHAEEDWSFLVPRFAVGGSSKLGDFATAGVMIAEEPNRTSSLGLSFRYTYGTKRQKAVVSFTNHAGIAALDIGAAMVWRGDKTYVGVDLTLMGLGLIYFVFAGNSDEDEKLMATGVGIGF